MLRRPPSISLVFLHGVRVRLTLLAVGVMLAAAPAANAQTQPPNVVLFLADDMGWTDWQYHATLNPTGSVVYETPNLLELAQSGIGFTEAYAASPVCSSTRVSVLTGKTPARTRYTTYATGNSLSTANLNQAATTFNIAASEITLAESLHAGGYATGFFGKWHVGVSATAVNPTQNGYDVNIGGGSYSSPDPAGGYFAGSDGMWAGMPGLNTPGQYPADKYLSDALAEHAGSFIQQHADEPFFVSFWDYGVHITLQAPGNLVTKYQNKISMLQSQGVDIKGHNKPVYAAMIEKLDQAVGALLDRLDDPNGDGNMSDSVRDNTIFVFTSDNGGAWAADGSPTRNLPLRESKGSLYDGGIREPLLLSWTGNSNIEQASVSDARTSSYDLYPTLSDLTGLAANPNVPKNANMDGVSIRAALQGDPFDRGFLYWHFPHISPQDNSSPLISGGTLVSAVSDDHWKMLFFYDDRHYELYNLDADIGETTNVLGQNPNVAFELSQALHNYLVSVGAQMPISKSTGQPVSPPPVLLPGDYNRDGVVGPVDFNLWRSNFGRSVPSGTSADGNGDGVVDAADYVVWRKHLSPGAGFGSAHSMLGAIPEPTSAFLAWIGLIGICPLLARSRRRHHHP